MTPEEVEVTERCWARWHAYEATHPEEAVDLSRARLYEKYPYGQGAEWEAKLAWLRRAEPVWRECWAEYDAYYQQQTSQSFFGSK